MKGFALRFYRASAEQDTAVSSSPLHSYFLPLHYFLFLHEQKILPLSHGVQADCVARADRLMLLGSPPDMVRGAPSHRTNTPHDRSKIQLYYVLFKPTYHQLCYYNIYLQNLQVLFDILRGLFLHSPPKAVISILNPQVLPNT